MNTHNVGNVIVAWEALGNTGTCKKTQAVGSAGTAETAADLAAAAQQQQHSGGARDDDELGAGGDHGFLRDGQRKTVRASRRP